MEPGGHFGVRASRSSMELVDLGQSRCDRLALPCPPPQYQQPLIGVQRRQRDTEKPMRRTTPSTLTTWMRPWMLWRPRGRREPHLTCHTGRPTKRVALPSTPARKRQRVLLLLVLTRSLLRSRDRATLTQSLPPRAPYVAFSPVPSFLVSTWCARRTARQGRRGSKGMATRCLAPSLTARRDRRHGRVRPGRRTRCSGREAQTRLTCASPRSWGAVATSAYDMGTWEGMEGTGWAGLSQGGGGDGGFTQQWMSTHGLAVEPFGGRVCRWMVMTVPPICVCPYPHVWVLHKLHPRFNGQLEWPEDARPQPPSCPLCGAERVFEFQVMTPALVALDEAASWSGVASTIPISWSWMTVAVFTCSAACQPSGGDQQGCCEEWTAVALE